MRFLNAIIISKYDELGLGTAKYLSQIYTNLLEVNISLIVEVSYQHQYHQASKVDHGFTGTNFDELKKKSNMLEFVVKFGIRYLQDKKYVPNLVPKS